MRKLFSLFAALTLSVGLWAETVPYIDATGASKTADATEITNASVTLAAGWYVVKGTNVQTGTLTCQGAVHIILADGAKLTATGDNTNRTPGIQVSGEGNSLTIYAQSTGEQSGQLIANGGGYAAGIGGGIGKKGSNITINGGKVAATGGDAAAGIGGGDGGDGSDITINGGEVAATGGVWGAGIGGGKNGAGSDITINGGTVTATGGLYAAGIGGGNGGSGSNITINGGIVTATGGLAAACIGGGKGSSAVNIFVATSLVVKADGNNPPTTVITNTGDDLASSLAGKPYATIKDPLPDIKTAAIADVNAEIAESDNDNVKAIATSAATAINAATSVAEVNTLKDLAIANIASAKAAYTAGETAGYTEGDAAGYQRAKDELPTEGTTGPAITITKGDKTVTFYNTDKVEYSIVDAD